MYPTIELFGITIYTFGTLMACAWFLFFILLHRFSWKKGLTKPIFSSIVSFTISIIFFARIFYIFSEWVEEKFILIDLSHGHILDFLRNFFTPQDYHFSLFGAVFGFLVVFLILTYHHKKDRLKYIDVITYAFLWSATLGYFAALLWGQVHGVTFHSPFSILYTHKNSIVDVRAPLFPLAILYMMISAGTLLLVDRLSRRMHFPDGYLGYLGVGVFSGCLFLWEFLSGTRKDMFYDVFSIGLTQIGALIGVMVAILGIVRLSGKRI